MSNHAQKLSMQLDQVWAILPVLKLLPLDCSRAAAWTVKGEQLECRQNRAFKTRSYINSEVIFSIVLICNSWWKFNCVGLYTRNTGVMLIYVSMHNLWFFHCRVYSVWHHCCHVLSAFHCRKGLRMHSLSSYHWEITCLNRLADWWVFIKHTTRPRRPYSLSKRVTLSLCQPWLSKTW